MMALFSKEKFQEIQTHDGGQNDHTVLIMVVDDERHTRNTLFQMLGEQYRVLVAGDGQEALEIVQHHPHPEQIHLILCDQRMPGMSGVDFLERTIPIIPDAVRVIVTAYTDVEDVIAAINRARIHTFIRKPFDRNDLLLTIERALETYDLKKQNDRLIAELQTLNAGLEERVREQTTELWQQRDMARMYFDFAGVIMMVIGANQKVMRINQKGCEVLGYSQDDIIGQNWFDSFVPAEMREDVKQVFQALMAGDIEPVEYYENPVLTRTGEERLIAWHNTVLRDEQGNITGTLGSGEDITERKQAEEQIRYQAYLLQHVSDAIIATDLELRIISWNTGAETLYGWQEHEVLGQNLDRLQQTEFLDETQEEAQKHLLAHGIWQGMVCQTRKNGDTIYVMSSVSLLRDSTGTPIGGVTVSHDVTDRKRAEEHVRFQAHVLDSVEQAVIATTPDGTVTYLNAFAETLYGWPAEDAVGRNIMDVTVPRMSAEQAQDIMSTLNRGESWQGEFVVQRKDGSRFPAYVVDSPVYNEKGEKVGVVGISSDITARKQAEDALQLNEIRLQLLLELHKCMDAPQSEILDVVLDAALQTVQSQYAFIGLLDEAESVLKIHAWSTTTMAQCAIEQPLIHFPIAEAGIWGDCVRRRQPVIINDYDAPHPSRKGIPDGHVPMTRFLGVPVFDGSRIVAVAAVANKVAPYTESDSQALQVLLDRMWGILRRKQIEGALKEAREELERIFQLTPDMICVAHVDGYFKRLNPAWTNVLGYTPEELMARPLFDFIHPDDREGTLAEIEKQVAGCPTLSFENRYHSKDGTYKWLAWQAAPADEKGFLYAAARDITDRKRAEERLKQSLKEKEVLLQELYHRTKNNMNVIGAMLSMQADDLDDQRVSLILEEIRQRIMAMAMVHEQLYQSQDLSHVDLRAYTEQLAVSILENYQVAAGHIALKVEVDPIVVLIETAIPYGQIVTEMMTNALKYAFPDGREGEIGIALHRLPGELELEFRFRDNGVGLPKDLDIRNTESFGMKLIMLLVDMQFRGTLDYKVDNGTEFRVRFQELDYTARV